jgi:MFS-type transporter involved in bile tolerance (Atg22 family)
MIMLLNFLIAMIGDTYSNVINNSMLIDYKRKMDLNYECLVLYN